MLWWVVNSDGLKDIWAFRLMFSAFHLFFGLGIAWLEALSFLPSPCSLLSCVRGPLGWESYHDTSFFLLYYYLSFISSLPMGLRANAPVEPVHFSHLYLFWALLVNIPIVLAHFISQASSAHLFLFYLFYFHGLFLNPLDFLGPITTALTLITFRAYWPLS